MPELKENGASMAALESTGAGGGLAEATLLVVLAQLLQHLNSATASDLTPQLLQKFHDFRQGWDRAVASFLAEPEKLIEGIKRISLQQVKRVEPSSAPPASNGFQTYGPFPCAVRSPGTDARLPRLPWQVVDTTSQLPSALADLVREVPPQLVQEIAHADLPFYSDHAVLWHLQLQDSSGSTSDSFAVTFGDAQTGEVQILDWTNEPIYLLNKRPLFRFSKSTDLYVRVFFHLVRTKEARFILLETQADLERTIPWSTNTDGVAMSVEQAIQLISRYLRPLEIGPSTATGEKRFRATILFKNALFRSDVLVSSVGNVKLVKETLLAEGLPIE